MEKEEEIEEQNEEINFSSIEEKCEYYKKQYEKYKTKYSSLKKEYIKLKEDNKKILENLNKERKMRINLEEKAKYNNISSQNNTFEEKNNNSLINKITFEEDDAESDENEEISMNNINNIKDININNSNEIIISEKIDNKIKENELINLDIKENENIIFNDGDENKYDNSIKIKDDNNNKIENLNSNDNEIIDDNNIINYTRNRRIISRAFTYKKNRNDKEEEEKDKNEEINEEKFLSDDLIIYGKDTISLRKNIHSKEVKINKLYYVLKKWRHHIENLKKGAFYFNKAIVLFNEHLALYNNKDDIVLKDFPFILDNISILQKCFSTINIYCSSLFTTIDSSCMIQINGIIKEDLKHLRELRFNLNNKQNEFLNLQSKFLGIKKNKKESKSLKEKYYNEYKNIEYLKYEYLCQINKILMKLKLKVPEMISLLAYSYIVFFSNIKDELIETNQIVRKNLEYLLNKSKIKTKLENDMSQNKKDYTDNLFSNIDNTLKYKEGFLYIKNQDKSKFEKRYVKLSDGNLVYNKIVRVNANDPSNNIENKKHLNMIDKIDPKETHEICNLLLSNVKKVEKDNAYPFCFEINIANPRKTFIFQAETEYEMEEWVSAITNSISEQISGFDENKIQNKNNMNIKDKNGNKDSNKNLILINDIIKNDNNNNNNKNKDNINDIIKNLFGIENKNEEEEKKKKIEKLINENICSDCGAQKPTWLIINWFTIICIECSSIHRSLGVQISKVRSLELDNISNEFIEILNLIKQSEINNILEEKLENDKEKPKFNSSREEKELFIINKYKEKKYMNIEIKEKDEIINEIFKSIEKNNLFDVFKLIKINLIDINQIYKIDNEEYGFIHHCIKFDKIYCLKLLYIMGADINLADSKGNKIKDLADKNKQINFISYLEEKENEKNK